MVFVGYFSLVFCAFMTRAILFYSFELLKFCGTLLFNNFDQADPQSFVFFQVFDKLLIENDFFPNAFNIDKGEKIDDFLFFFF